ncbi:MAG: hypothetical protein K0S93_106 [Nitrososphaeraceae archaeon]|jgi:hypothetical protein|nr:hypothetical protein [Nitrososphaeraceae archaeon]
MKNKIILSLTIVFFVGTVVSIQSQNVYGLVSITTVTWNDVQIEEGSQVVPSQDRPLEFVFQSNDENNADLSADFQCEILRINDVRLVDPGDIQNGLDIDGDGQLDVAQSDVQQVFSQSCGDNVASSSITITSLIEGTDIFRVTAIPLSGSQPVTSDTFVFDVPKFQVSEDVSITTANATWNEINLQPFDFVLPSQDRPLEFTFELNDETNNQTVPYNFTCEVFKINNTMDDENNNPNTINSIDIDGNGVEDISESDLQQVTSDNCGTNTLRGTITYTSSTEGTGFSKGTYVFIVTADPLISGEKITRITFPFIVPL